MPPTAGFDLAPGALFNDRYQIVRRMSEGGMGAVFEAIHLDTRRRRALKLMRPELLADAGARARFKLEAQVAAEIESEHIVEVVDAGIDPSTGAPFIVMELLRGEDLGSALARRGRLPPVDVVDVLAQAARALDRTHAAGIVHRDLKPENLFLAQREDGTTRVKVLDFGIAKVVEDSRHHTHATASIGTPVFMAPEQISGARIGPSADVYALGHIAFALLCGSAYWDVEASAGNVYSLLVKVGAGAPEPALARAAALGVALPGAFEAWFARATALSPDDRFMTAGEAVIDLAKALSVPAPVIARPIVVGTASLDRLSGASGPTGYGATLPSRGGSPRRRWSLFAALLGATILGGAAAGIHIVISRGGPVDGGGAALSPVAAAPGDSPPPATAKGNDAPGGIAPEPRASDAPSAADPKANGAQGGVAAVPNGNGAQGGPAARDPKGSGGATAGAQPPRVEPAPVNAPPTASADAVPRATTSTGPRAPAATAPPKTTAPPPTSAPTATQPSNPLLTR